MKSAWLMCKRILPGMFSDEAVATFVRRDGEEESHFVRLSSVNFNTQSIKVDVLERESFVWARLPTQHLTQVAVLRDNILWH